ncbi:membrane protein insertase YidC [Candidatus Falkowbacteria bacterium]|nr:membrane protein insertase YidC [Candidatus Falkowbacteria bacterium]
MLATIYNAILYQPLFNLLVWLYNVIPGHDIGLAIIALTVIIKLILYPFTLQSIRAQKAMQELQPKLEAIKKKYKDNKEKLSLEMMNLYKNNKVNPLSSCLPLLIQLPFLIAVYQVFRQGLSNGSFDLLYPFVANPGAIDPHFLGSIDLAAPQIVLAILAGAGQFWQAKMLQAKRPPTTPSGKLIPGAKDESMMATMNKQMMYMMPLMTVIIGMRLPGGLTLYWLVTTVLTGVMQLWLFRKKDNKADGGSASTPAVIEGEVVK